MTIKEMINTYGKGRGEEVMWKSVDIISKYIEDNKDKSICEYEKLEKNVYSAMAGKHFNEEFGKECVSKMFYVDSEGTKHVAPYWIDSEISGVYEAVKPIISVEYTEWDFIVTANMMMSDYHNVLKNWFPDYTEKELGNCAVELAVEWLKDPDSECKDCKIWKYFE